MTVLVDLMKVRRQRFGGAQFMLCGNCMDETYFLAIVAEGKPGPVITGLLCVGPKCPADGTLTSLVNGCPQD